MKIHFLFLLAASGLLISGCKRQPTVVIEVQPTPMPIARTETFETHALRKEIDAYERTPSTVQGARVDKAFAEIDGEIAELVEYIAKHDGEDRAEAARKLVDLRAYRDAEKVRFTTLRAKAPVREVGVVVEPKDGTAEKVGEKIDHAARKVEDGLREAADAVRDRTRFFHDPVPP